MLVIKRKEPSVRIKYKLNVEVVEDGKVKARYDVGTLQQEPVIQYLSAILKCVGFNTSYSCMPAGSISSVSIMIQASGGYNVAMYPSTSGVGQISNLSGNISHGSFSISFTATLSNSSLSGTYTVNTLYITATNGSFTFTMLISNLNISAQNGNVLNVTLSGTVVVSPSSVLNGLYLNAFNEFWTEVMDALGISIPYKPIPWESGNSATGIEISVSDPSGNVIGYYNSATSSSQNISNVTLNWTQSGLNATVQVQFALTPSSSDEISTVGFAVLLNASSMVTVSSLLLSYELPVSYSISPYYQVNAGNTYIITLQDTISVSTST